VPFRCFCAEVIFDLWVFLSNICYCSADGFVWKFSELISYINIRICVR